MVEPITDMFTTEFITELTNIAAQVPLTMINLWNGTGIGKVVLSFLLVIFMVGLIIEFFKFAQDMIRIAFEWR